MIPLHFHEKSRFDLEDQAITVEYPDTVRSGVGSKMILIKAFQRDHDSWTGTTGRTI
jgi:hypothetical protein